MVRRRFQPRIDGDHSKGRLPVPLPPISSDAFLDQQKRDGMMARVRLGNRDGADRETVSFRELRKVSLMFLDKEVVAAPDRSDQRYRQGAGYCQSHALFAPLSYLLRAEALSLGQCFSSQARVPARLDHRNKDVVGKLN